MQRKQLLRVFVPVLVVVLIVTGVLTWQGRGEPVFTPTRIPDATLIIDAGHGGEDGGAVSPSGVVESHINLAVAQRLKALMDLCGVKSVLLRESDISLHNAGCETLRQKKVSDLHNRVAAIEGTPNSILISIHQNTFQSKKYHGAQVFFGLNEDSLSLAQFAQDSLREGLDPENSRIPAQIPSSVYLMKHVTCPAILVECGFLSNPTEEQLLQTPAYQTKIAVSLACAYLNYQHTAKEGEIP